MFTNANTFFVREDFAALPDGEVVDRELFMRHIEGLALSVPIADVQVTSNGGVGVDWGSVPLQADIAALSARVATFAGGTTSRAPLVAEVLAPTNATVENQQVTVIDVATQPREAGTYLITAAAMVGMLAVVTNTGARGSIVFELIRAGDVIATRTYSHGTREQEPQTLSPSLTFVCEAGDRIRALVTVTKLGTAAATARMAGVRLSIVQLSPV